MHYLYLDTDGGVVHIVLQERPDLGRFLGSVTDADFRKIRTPFLAQALIHRARLGPITGLTILIESGPATRPIQ